MKSNRPVNLNLGTFKFPVTSISSILHRITGVLLFISIPFCLWALQSSLNEQGFAQLKQLLTATFPRLILWLILSMLAYHIIAGIRHLLMDAGIGESLQAGRLGSYLVIVSGFICAVLIGVWLW